MLVAAALAPLIGIATRRIGLSIVVIELLLGIVIGPQGLGLVAPTARMLAPLSTLGMAVLFFVAGLEIDLEAIRGRPLAASIAGWVLALGVLVPILRDAGAAESPFGRYVPARGTVGELAPIIVMSLVLSTRHDAGTQAGLTLVFIVLALALAWLLTRGAQIPALLPPLRRGLDQSGQLPVRLVFVLVGGLALLAENFGLDLALGALAAGMMTGSNGAPSERTGVAVASGAQTDGTNLSRPA
ncbi:MAG: cation:proton antiporter [Burkholderiales bacterium]